MIRGSRECISIGMQDGDGVRKVGLKTPPDVHVARNTLKTVEGKYRGIVRGVDAHVKSASILANIVLALCLIPTLGQPDACDRCEMNLRGEKALLVSWWWSETRNDCSPLIFLSLPLPNPC